MNLSGVKALVGAAYAALFAFALTVAPAVADTGTDITLPAGTAPVVHVQMRSGSLTVRTWNQPQVHVTSSQPISAQHFGTLAVERALRGGDIPIFATNVQTPSGPITLPAEDFSVGSLGGDHDGVTIFGGDVNAAITLNVPANTAFLLATIGRGSVQIQDYHTGSFVARVHNGAIQANNVSGEGYLEVARGGIHVADSSFDRIRARTAIGNIIFENCNAKQIEVSSVDGTIAYDNGTFAPGLARFESQNGNVAIGVTGGGVQIGAHSASGKIFENFDRAANIRGNPTDAQAIVDGGGPVVTASSDRGGVYLYNGAFKAHPQLGTRWRPLGRVFNRRSQQKPPQDHHVELESVLR